MWFPGSAYRDSVQEVIWRERGWSRLEDWKRHLVGINAKSAAAAGAAPFLPLDFSAPHEIVLEPLPADRRQPMRGYFESSHYRKATGDAILTRLAGGPEPAGFGVPLTMDNHREQLARMRDAARARYPKE